MEFVSVPGFAEAHNLSTLDLSLIAVAAPIALAVIVGLRREVALIAAAAGMIGVIMAQ